MPASSTSQAQRRPLLALYTVILILTLAQKVHSEKNLSFTIKTHDLSEFIDSKSAVIKLDKISDQLLFNQYCAVNQATVGYVTPGVDQPGNNKETFKLSFPKNYADPSQVRKGSIITRTFQTDYFINDKFELVVYPNTNLKQEKLSTITYQLASFGLKNINDIIVFTEYTRINKFLFDELLKKPNTKVDDGKSLYDPFQQSVMFFIYPNKFGAVSAMSLQNTDTVIEGKDIKVFTLNDLNGKLRNINDINSIFYYNESLYIHVNQPLVKKIYEFKLDVILDSKVNSVTQVAKVSSSPGVKIKDEVDYLKIQPLEEIIKEVKSQKIKEERYMVFQTRGDDFQVIIKSQTQMNFSDDPPVTEKEKYLFVGPNWKKYDYGIEILPEHNGNFIIKSTYKGETTWYSLTQWPRQNMAGQTTTFKYQKIENFNSMTKNNPYILGFENFLIFVSTDGKMARVHYRNSLYTPMMMNTDDSLIYSRYPIMTFKYESLRQVQLGQFQGQVMVQKIVPDYDILSDNKELEPLNTPLIRLRNLQTELINPRLVCKIKGTGKNQALSFQVVTHSEVFNFKINFDTGSDIEEKNFFWLIAGMIAGGILLVIVIIIVVCLLKRKKIEKKGLDVNQLNQNLKEPEFQKQKGGSELTGHAGKNGNGEPVAQRELPEGMVIGQNGEEVRFDLEVEIDF